MRSVSVISTGMTAFGAFPDRTIVDLARDAGAACLENAGVEPEALYLGNFAGPGFTGKTISPQPWARRWGSTAFPARASRRLARLPGRVRSRLGCRGGRRARLRLGHRRGADDDADHRADDGFACRGGDLATEVSVGATFPALFAMIAARYFHEFGATREHLAAVAMKNHANGLRNPRAHMRKAITMQKALVGRMIAEPLTLYDCSLISDSAAAVLLAPTDSAPDGVRVRGIGQASDKLALADKSDITTFPAVRAAAAKAYQMAGLTPETSTSPKSTTASPSPN
ncbi:MAG: hypothetical protein R2748_25365 [Bryobacterales bacterium]